MKKPQKKTDMKKHMANLRAKRGKGGKRKKGVSKADMRRTIKEQGKQMKALHKTVERLAKHLLPKRKKATK